MDAKSRTSNANQSSHSAYALIYDGSCPLCRAAVRGLERLDLLRKAHAVRVEDVSRVKPSSPRDLESILTQTSSELVLYNMKTGRRLGGVSAAIELASIHGRFGVVASALRIPFVAMLASALYKTVALNRRTISPPDYPGPACRCDPPFNLGYALSFWAGVLVLLFTEIAVFGWSLSPLHPGKGTWDTFFAVLAIVGAGWAASALVLSLLHRGFISQSVMALASGLLLLYPLAVLNRTALFVGVSPALLTALNWGLMGAVYLVVLLSLRSRFKRLGLPAWTTWLSIVLMVSAAAALIVRFGLFDF